MGYKVFVPDLPGFGENTPLERAWITEDYIDWIKNFAVNNSLERFFLVGHSFGGGLAAVFSAQFPEQVEKLILLPIIVPNLRVLEEDTKVELTDLIGDDTYSPDIIAEGRITKEDLNSLLQGELTPKEEMVIRFRFGFGTDECTLEEIGEKWDRSRERIRQIEKKALRKLKLKISEYYKELC